MKSEKLTSAYFNGFLKAAKDLAEPQELYNVARKPEVQNYVNQLQDRKKTRERAFGWKLPATGAALAGAGYGLHRLGDAAITPDDRRTVEDLGAIGSRTGTPPDISIGDAINHPANAVFPSGVPTSKDYQGSSSLFWDYIDRASRASKVKVYGHPVVDLLHKGKHILGIPDGQPDSASARDIETANHYPAFEKGPVDAYVHQLIKNIDEPLAFSRPNQYFKYPEDDSGTGIPLTNQDYASINNMYKNDLKDFSTTNNPTVNFYHNWKNDFNNYLQAQGYKPMDISPQGFKLDDSIHNLNQGQQLDLARNFTGYLQNKDPQTAQMHDNLLKVLADKQVDAAHAYGNVANVGVHALQDAPRIAGNVAMLGGGALGLMWLLSKLKHRKHQQESPIESIQAQQPA